MFSKRYSHVLLPHYQESDVEALTAGAATVTLTVPAPYARTHWFAAVEFYSDSAGATQVEPTAGTATFTVVTPLLPNNEQEVNSGVAIDYSIDTNVQVSWQSNTLTVKLVLDSISGNSADYARLRIMGNAS